VRIAVFGLGYVGSVAVGCLASQGHSVIGFDIDETKVAAINAGNSPIIEPGLDRLIAEAARSGKLSAATGAEGKLDSCDIAFVCVGTPSADDGQGNTQERMIL